MAKMTQTQIIGELSTKTGIAKKQVKDFLESLTDLAYREAKKGEFAFPGLGKLVKQKRKARIGRNPATGVEVKVPAKTVLKFRVAKAAKDAVLGSSGSERRSGSDSDLDDVLREIGRHL
jgi:DNA-binding protein HU-beta